MERVGEPAADGRLISMPRVIYRKTKRGRVARLLREHYSHLVSPLPPAFPSFVASRTFTLLSKILQNLANLIEFGQKEPFLADMNQYILAKKGDMKRFLDTVSSLAPADKPGLADEPEIDLQVEMATMYHHLVNMRPAIAEHHTDSPTFGRLVAVLDAIGRSQFSPRPSAGASSSGSGGFRPATASGTGPRTGLLGSRRG
ncbi:C2 domain containing protein [Acanthamoeba castellanii str. Neff]|uniref:C2 domain containing protein n=1 Tax=Acanthamoeba castellanii (strain ATCC 30010 / Neff) TaxID=1257118 RepID=L8H2Z8_ACACF|nr:C2 domain containing protein [Acanthamoeba castellanii str. Neff]ELR19575.1 C2 domain containing protein [Acanthamoeba castellanii str. Neff]